MKRPAKTISVTIEKTVVEKLQQEAVQENRTLSSKIRLILRGYFRRSEQDSAAEQPAEETCGSCAYFQQHYVREQGWYTPIACGHCTHPCFKVRKPSGAACENLISGKEKSP